jgi:hypothetical protein
MLYREKKQVIKTEEQPLLVMRTVQPDPRLAEMLESA